MNNVFVKQVQTNVKSESMRFLTQLQEKELREYYSVTNKNITYKGDFK